MGNPARAKLKTAPEGPAHAESHLLRVWEDDWQTLSRIADVERRSRKAQLSVIIDDYVTRHPELLK